jgi:hypothetical protein
MRRRERSSLSKIVFFDSETGVTRAYTIGKDRRVEELRGHRSSRRLIPDLRNQSTGFIDPHTAPQKETGDCGPAWTEEAAPEKEKELWSRLFEEPGDESGPVDIDSFLDVINRRYYSRF